MLPRCTQRFSVPLALATLASGCVAAQPASGPAPQTTGGRAVRLVDPAAVVIASPDAGETRRPPFRFSEEDERLLDEVQRGAFSFLWNDVDPATGMVWDRSSKAVISVAGVGFQLSALPVGISRGFISEEEGRERALRILRALEANPKNRKAGLFFHYLAPGDAGPTTEGYETVISTIDSALLFAGVITAGVHFGGEVAEIADRLVAAADWRFFVSGDEARPHERGFVSLGWKPRDVNDPTGEGGLLPYYWIDSGDEHRLVAFLGVAAPREEHRLTPEEYYHLRRALGEYPGVDGEVVWFPWSGALFVSFFAHCWIDHASMGADDPGRFGFPHRSRVDWWENARRTVQMHRIKARENPKGLPTLGEHAWGLTACDAETGYLVPGLFPNPLRMRGAVRDRDYAPVRVEDKWGDGTVAPYGAGSAIMFQPEAAVAALRYYRGLKDAQGRPLVWREPGVEGPLGGHGFLDSFRFGPGNTPDAPGGWVAHDYVAIDQGPLILAIENARSGLVWDLFHRDANVRGAVERLGLSRNRTSR